MRITHAMSIILPAMLMGPGAVPATSLAEPTRLCASRIALQEPSRECDRSPNDVDHMESPDIPDILFIKNLMRARPTTYDNWNDRRNSKAIRTRAPAAWAY